MPYDAGVTTAIVYELREKITGGRVEKINQPTKDEIIFQIYSKSEHYRLALDADANSPKVYLAEKSGENPPVPPMFCNILRKYLQNAKIGNVAQIDFDRVFEFEFESFDEMGFSKPMYLYVECIRKQSNVILCNENKKIISAAKFVDFSLSERRQILNGLLYISPSASVSADNASEKINPLSVSKEQFCEDYMISAKEADIPIEKYLLTKYQGLSPLITREVAYLSCKDTSAMMSGADVQRTWFYFDFVMQKIRDCRFTPTLLCNEKSEPIDFSYIDIRQYENKASAKYYKNMCELVAFYFYKKDYDNKIRQKSQDILKVLSNASSRLNKKIKLLEKDLDECKSKEKFKIYGDIITANIYRLSKGMSKAELENFYDSNNIIAIPLDINITPPQNAQRYYKRYAKLKTAEFHINKQLETARNDIIYIDSVFESLTRTLSERELSEIRAELAESGITKKKSLANNKVKKGKKPPKQLPVSKPDEFKSTNGFKILCGRNNKQNDDLTFRIAGKNDIWFHAQKIPGSHTVLICENTGRVPDNKDIEDAAKIAATHSKGKNMPLVPVDYTSARYVKKPGGAKPGFVTYTNFKTASVKPEI